MVFTNSAEAFSRCICLVAKVPLGIPDLFPAQQAGRGEEGRPEEGRLEGARDCCVLLGAGCGAGPGAGRGSGVATPASRLQRRAHTATYGAREAGQRRGRALCSRGGAWGREPRQLRPRAGLRPGLPYCPNRS